MFGQVLIALGSATIASVLVHSAAVAQSSVFCSDDAAALLGDVCVDSQGRMPDNADIRSIIVGSCQLDSSRLVSANATGTVRASLNMMWGEYRFCSRELTSNNQSIYYLRSDFDNSIVYQYSTQDESWGRLNIFSYSVQTGELNGRLTTFTRNGRELSEPESAEVNTSNMYSALSDLLALQNISPRVAREVMP
jgi:hypothetical protein